MLKQKVIAISVFLSIVLLSLFISVALIINSNNYSSSIKQQNLTYFEYTQVINEVSWLVKYEAETHNIVCISASYHINDKSSSYWEDIALQHGDHSLWVDYDVTLIGTPMEENWFKIEKHETYSFNSEILADFTTRYEEKLIFTISPNSPTLNDR